MADGITGLQLALAQRQGARPQRVPIPVLPSVRRRNMLTFEEMARRQQVIQKAAEKKQNSRSLWEQTTDAVGGFVKGVFHMGADIGKEVLSTPLKLADFVQGDLSAGDLAKSYIPMEAQYALGVADTVAGHYADPAAMQFLRDKTGMDATAKYNPVMSGMGRSMGNTILDVRHPGRFADAVREGRIVDKITEDVTNAAMVLGPVGKLAGMGAEEAAAAGQAGRAAALERVGNVADTLHTPGRSAMRGLGAGAERLGLPNVGAGLRAGAEMAPVRAAVKGVGIGADSLFNRALAAGEDTIIGGSARGLRKTFPQFLTPEGRFMRSEARQAQLAAGREKRAVEGLAWREHVKGGARTVEEGAASALVNALGEANTRLAEMAGLSPEQVREVWATKQLPEQGYTPEIDQMVRDYLDGSLDPEVRARVDQHVSTIQDMVGSLEEQNLAGAGRVSGGLDWQQLENGPVDAAMYAELNRLRDAGTIDNAAIKDIEAARAEGVAWEDIAAYDPTVEGLLGQYNVYPSRWRPAMRASAMTQDMLNEQAASSPPGPAILRLSKDDLALSIGRPQGAYFSLDPQAGNAYGPQSAEGFFQLSKGPSVTEGYAAGRNTFDAPKAHPFESANEAALRQMNPEAHASLSQMLFDNGNVDAALAFADGQMGVRFDPTTVDFLRQDAPSATMEAIGGEVARKAGYDSVRSELAGRPDLAEYVALHPDAFSASGSQPVPLLPFTPDELLAAGVPDPTYLPGGESSLFEPKGWRISNEPTNIGISGLRGTTGEATRMVADTQPYSLRTLGEQVGEARRVQSLNKAVLKIMGDERIPSASHIIPDDQWSMIEQSATREARSQLPGAADHEVAARAKLLQNNEIVRALQDRGYEVIVGDRHNPQVGDFNPQTRVDTAKMDINKDTVVLPRNLKNKISQNYKDLSVPLAVLRYINRKFKGAVLPFSVRWQVGDLVGGAFMSWVGGGVNPLELAAGMRKVKELSPEAEAATLHNKNFVDSGMAAQERSFWTDALAEKEPKTAIGRFQRKSFAFNEAINHTNRSGYLIAKLDKMLRERGMSIDGVEKGGGWNDPAVTKVIDEVVEDANRTMGAFDRLTPAERRYMTTAFPFYAWTRHITTLAFRTAIDNPNRIAWTLRLGAMGTDPNEDLPDWLKGAITVPDGLAPDAIFGEGDQLLSTQFLNPFNDVTNNPGYTPAGMMRSLSPGIKVPAALLFGVEPNPSDQLNPIRQITRPYGEDRNPLIDGLQSLISSFPVAREAQSLAPTGTIAGLSFGPHPRYHSGRNMVDRWGNPIDTSSRWQSPLRLAGIPLPTSKDDAVQIQAVARARAESKKKKKSQVNKG